MAWCFGKTTKVWQTGFANRTIHKNKDRSEGSRQQDISILGFPGKLFAKCLEKRCREITESKLEDTQCGFCPDRSTADEIITLQLIVEKSCY